MSKNIIELADVWEKYRIKFVDHNRVSWDEFWALEGIDLQLAGGEVLGVIGENGAGKTTLLKIISGMLIPDKGKVDVRGRVSVLMELGAGFNQEFTGRENIMLNTRMYGVAEDILEEQVKRIIDFADLGRFIDAPIKHYSQGMYMRLAFALAIFVEPDILLIDDILAVGDEEARQKCIKKIIELKDAGKNIILVSHDMDTVKHLCHRVILIEKGKVIKQGDAKQVIQYYLDNIGNRKGILSLQQDGLRLVFNNGRISISYNEVPVSKGTGGYVVFLNPGIDSWASSRDLSWEVKDSSPTGFTAEGTLEDGTKVQVWTIRFSEGKLSWNIEIKNHSLAEQHIDLFLDPQYTKWFSLEDEREFPFFVHKTRWQETGFQKGRCQFLAIGQKEPAGSNPGIIFEPGNNNIQLQILNTGYEQESRVLQVYPDAQDNISINLNFFLSQDKFQEYIRAFRERHLLKQKAEQEKLLTERTLTHGDIRLFVDVDHKMIRLYYRDKEVTKGCGLHSSFLLNRKWHDFVNFSDWRVSKNNDTLFLRLNQRSPELEQNWKISLAQDKLIWEVESSSGDSFSPEMFKLGLLLNNDYNTFFCGDQEAAFPKEFTVWQDIPLENPRARLLGLKKTANLPAVTMLNKDNLDCIIQNSDLSSSSRVIQLGLDKGRIGNKQKIFFATQINFSQDNSQIDSYLKAEQEKLLTERTLTHGDIRLFVDVDHKMIRLYYRDKEVTQGHGLHSSFLLNRQWSEIKEAQWSTRKISSGGVSLVCSYPEWPFLEIWEFSVTPAGSIGIRVDIESAEETAFDNFDVRLQLSTDYEKWATTFEKGNLAALHFIDKIAPVRLKESKVSQMMIIPGEKNSLPRVLFKATLLPENRIFGVYRVKDEPEDLICVNSSLIIPKRKAAVFQKRRNYFSGEVFLGKEAVFDQKEKPSGISANIKKDKLNVFFDQGRGRIEFDGRELSSGLHVYTSLRSGGIWYDSYQAVWKLIDQSPTEMVFSGDWPYIPVSQIWRFKLEKNNLIFWEVEMEVYKEAALEIEQSNLMLSTQYTNWEAPGSGGGEFPAEFTSQYDILPFRSYYGTAKELIAVSPGLPRVFFVNLGGDPGSRVVVENSDDFYSSRLLQFQRTNPNKLKSGKYPYFKGEIRVER